MSHYIQVQVQFIDAWNQIWKLRAVHLPFMCGFICLQYCTIIQYRRGLIIVEWFRLWYYRHAGRPWWRHPMKAFSASLALCAGNSPASDKGQWRRALMFPFIFAWTNSWACNRETGDLRRHRSHYDATVMLSMVKVLRWVYGEQWFICTNLCMNHECLSSNYKFLHISIMFSSTKIYLLYLYYTNFF